MARPNPNKFDYKWKVGDILRTTRDIDFGSDIVKKGTIVYIFRRFQGYNFVCLKPELLRSQSFEPRLQVILRKSQWHNGLVFSMDNLTRHAS